VEQRDIYTATYLQVHLEEEDYPEEEDSPEEEDNQAEEEDHQAEEEDLPEEEYHWELLDNNHNQQTNS